MVHKSVMKVDVSCDKCKQELFAIVSKLEGVNKIEADTEKGTIAVIGVADPFAIIKSIRKAGKSAYFVSVGPPPKPDEKKDEKKCTCSCLYPYPYSYSYPGGCYSCKPDEKKGEKKDEKKDEKKCTCSCPYPYPYSYSYPGGCYSCKPVAMMTMDYQDPTPPCTIM